MGLRIRAVLVACSLMNEGEDASHLRLRGKSLRGAGSAMSNEFASFPHIQ